MERALLPVVRDGKTIYIVRHMPPSFRYLTRIDKINVVTELIL